MNAPYRKLAGRLQAQAGSPERAQAHYRAALEWGAEDPDVRRALDDMAGAQAPGRRGFFGKAG
jgi:hypothetical protein